MTENYPLIDKKNTGNQIRKLMNQRRLAVRDVQAYMGFSTPQAVYHWLGGRSLPSLDNIYALSALLQVSVDEIICGNRRVFRYQTDSGRRLKFYIDRIKKVAAA